MKKLLIFLNNLGILVPIDESSSPIVLFALCILVLSVVSLLCFINILLYFMILYITEHKILLDKLPTNVLFIKILNFYKQTRIFFIFVAVTLLVFSLCSIIYLCSKVIQGLL